MHLGGVQEIQVDVRIIAATNVDLKQLVKEGKFRDDLYYRLNVITVDLPSLRQRKEDIPLLVDFFLQRYSQENGRPIRRITPEALRPLMAYSWPGNVRELENAIERACILSDTMLIEPKDLGLNSAPMDSAEALKLFDLTGNLSEVGQRALRLVERQKVVEALVANNNNKMQAAEDLGVSYKTLLTKIKDYQLG